MDNVEIVHGRFEDQTYDCMVSAANSFGLMDGGVDGAITAKYGNQLSDRVRDYIKVFYLGEQPIGTSFIIPTDLDVHAWETGPFLAHTPTMRVPAPCGPDDVYRAMWGMLLAVHEHNSEIESTDVDLFGKVAPIKTVCCPGLGTLTGRVPADEAARQMATAYRFYLAGPPEEITWHYASNRAAAVIPPIAARIARP